MKKISILFILVFSLSNFMANAQIEGEADYLVKYKADFALDSTQLDQRTEETHYLYTGSSVSFYASEAIIRIDSMFKEMQNLQGNREAMMRKGKEMRENTRKRGLPGFLAEVYKDFNKKETWVESRVSRDQFIYQEPEVPLHWQMADSTKQIGSRIAQKATASFSGRDWTAWFTPEVPIHDGPYVFSGLPGLILELYDARKDYHFSVASIKHLKKAYAVSSDKGYKEVSKEKFVKAYKNFRKNPFGPMESQLRSLDMKIPDPMTGEKVDPSEFIRRIKDMIAKRNNYIELW